MKLFKMGKNVRIKILILWFVKWLKYRVGQGFIFHVIVPVHCFLVKILLVTLKNLHTSAYLNLNYCTTKQKPQM